MYLNKLAFRIERLLSSKASSLFTDKQIAKELRIKPFEYDDLMDTIEVLVREKRVTKASHKYSYPAEQAIVKSQKLIEGVFDATPLARNMSFAFVRTEKVDIYISAEDTLTAYNDDIVLVEPVYKRGTIKYGIIREIKERARTQFVGNFLKYKSAMRFINDNSKIHTDFTITDGGKAQPGTKVILEINDWGDRAKGILPSGKVVEVLGQAGAPAVEMLGIMRQYDLPLEFPEEVLAEAAAIPDIISSSEIKRRKDFRSLLTLTIDPISAKDYDDAISIEKTRNGWLLYVHIADVAHFVKPGTKLFEEAVNRGNSYYFPKKVLPMLPERISNKLCSLRPDEDKFTLTVVTEFDKRGERTYQALYESIIRSDCRLAYEQVDELFDGKESAIPTEVQQALLEMRKLALLLTAKRKEQGYLFFDLPETEYSFDEEGNIQHLTSSVQTESHTLIENFMLTANEYTAEKLTALAPATMYRVHEFPETDRLMRLKRILNAYGMDIVLQGDLHKTIQSLLLNLEGEDYHKVFDKMVLRSMKKARYATQHLPHFGLAMPTYTHFTSPIRRLCDLIIHHQLKTHVLHISDIAFNRVTLDRYAQIASDKEIIADDAEREVDHFTMGVFMKQRLGEDFKGLIVNLNSRGLLVQLDDIPVTGMVLVKDLKEDYFEFDDLAMQIKGKRSGITFHLVQHVNVKVVAVGSDIIFKLNEMPQVTIKGKRLKGTLPKYKGKQTKRRK